MGFSFKGGLLAAAAGVAIMVGTTAAAQTTPAPTAPTGGFYMANGTRTTNYQTAIASWRNGLRARQLRHRQECLPVAHQCAPLFE